MPSADDPGPGPEGTGLASQLQGGQVHSQLVEALVLVLIEKGVLTRNDALSIIQTVAEVKRGEAVEARDPAQIQAALQMLQRMYLSFEALADRPGTLPVDGENVLHLRPPIHGDRPQFPLDD